MENILTRPKSLTTNLLKFGIPALFVGVALFANQSSASDAKVVELTQVNCQFLESENDIDHGFDSSGKADCDQVHQQSGKDRLADAKTIELTPGDYIFRVTNKDVSYPLGFYLRGAGITGKVTLPKVSGGGLATGVTKDYKISLKPGEYVYSCPLNSTLDYKLVVSSN